MPGILPMKVIKVGTSAQSRIAQACDRCRSKKIRCDGVRPTCSQCANVGFECRTSDKLSRRAFPRGYTESLEERIRQLESEVTELKDLLDEKDEKIDVLSAMHGAHHRGASLAPASNPSPAPDAPRHAHPPPPRDDSFRVQAAPLLLGLENSDSYFMGPSSGRTLITSFKRKLQETGKPSNDFNPEAFLHVQGCPPLAPDAPDPQASRVPPRLFSDRCVNVFFQEWAPLFPVLHKLTFLATYDEFVTDPEKIKCSYKVAQLYLVFSIAGLSAEAPDYARLASCERQWSAALESLQYQSTMATLQCLILALLYCAMRADNKRLQHYKAVAVALSHRLGLHQSQKRFSFGALTLETRKKVFWTLYTLDCFTAATMGLPKLLRDDDVQAEYPSDTDDEYITERGFQPTLPGEYTRLSSALALFRATRVLSRVLEDVYPASTGHELSLHKMAGLERDLDAWYAELPAHLRLNFVQDKPSTDVTGSRSPLLALAYYYIRTLVYRPAVGSTLGPKAAPALLSIADSSKHIVQIVQLLEERSMSFSFCLNKLDLVAVCGTTLLYQVVDLGRDGKMAREAERLVNVVIAMLVKAKAPGALDLTRVARTLVSVDDVEGMPPPPLRKGSMAAPPQRPSLPSRAIKKKPGQGQAAADQGVAGQQLPPPPPGPHDKMRRMTMSHVPPPAAPGPELYRSPSRQSFDSLSPEGSAMSLQDYRVPTTCVPRPMPNLDYLPLGNHRPRIGRPGVAAAAAAAGPPRMQPPGPPQAEHVLLDGGQGTGKMAGVSTAEWEALLGSMDSGLNNVYDAIYGGGGGVGVAGETQLPTDGGGGGHEWSPDAWDLSGFNLGDFGGDAGGPQSVPSISDESLSSGEEVAPSELGLSVDGVEYHHGNHGRMGRAEALEAYAL